LQYVNRPEDIEAIYNEIPMDDMILENCSRCGFRYYMKGLADVELGNYDKVIKNLVPVTNIIELSYLKRPIIMAYVKSGKLTELEKFLSDNALTASISDIDYLNIFTGIQLINNNQTEEANKYFNKIITRNNNLASNQNLAKAYYYKGDYLNAQNIYASLIQEDSQNIEYTVHLAVSYFKNGDFEAAQTQIEKLDSLRKDYQFGFVDYGWAQYYNSIGDKDNALEFLLKAVVQGFNYTPSTFQNDPHFRTIKDSPEFKNRIMNYWKNKTI
jgi:tetratricopeptide (TPR) repeat protein